MEATAVKCALIVLLLLARKTSSQCEGNTKAVLEQSNHSIQVSETFEGSTLALYCNITDGELLYGQQLIWSEGGVEIKDSLTSHYQTSRTSSMLTFLNASDYRYGEYSCRCYNRFNYTVDTIEDYIRNSSNIFSPYCSMPASTIISPDQESNSSWIVYHNIDAPGEMIKVSCDNNSTSTLLYLLHNSEGTVVMWEEPMYTISTPSDQAKFLCMLQEEVVQVHYVMIKDYSPLKFIVPNPGSQALNVESNRKTVLCAIVSPREPELLEVSVEFLYVGVIGIGTGTSYGYLHAVYSEVSAVDLRYECQAKTAWEDITISYRITTRPRSEHSPVPEIRVYASIYMLPNNTVEVGGRAVVRCRVTGNHHNRVEVSVKYNNSIYDVEMVKRGLEYTDYHLVVDDLYKEGYREYTCIGELYEHCIREANVTYLNVISSNVSDHEEDKASSSIRPSQATPTTAANKATPTSFVNDSSAATTSDIERYITSTASSRHLATSSSNTGLDSTAMTSSHSTANATTSSTSAITSSISSYSSSDTGFNSAAISSNNASAALASTDVLVTTITSIIFAIMVVIFLVIVTLFVLVCCRKWSRKRLLLRRRMCRDTTSNCASDFDSVSISISSTFPSLFQSPSFASKTMTKFIQELTMSRWYIPYTKLQVHEVLGSGAFGIVRKATGYDILEGHDQKQSTVAIKMLKAYATEEEQRDIITEFSMLQRVGTHKNIVNLIGASSHKGRLVVIVEYCSGGNLLNYLRRSRTDTEALTPNHQLNMALQVAEGMEYLASKKCVHRDLATRNILITEEGTLKVADFGLAREMYHSVYAKSSKGKIPFKWMSPESIFDNVYTVKSDVWSFGILLWEISTKGLSPYPGKTVAQLLDDVKCHRVMEKHDECPAQLYKLMLQCWKYDPNERPSFTELVRIIQSEAPDVANYVCEINQKNIGNQYIEADIESLDIACLDDISVCKTLTSPNSHHIIVKQMSTSSAETGDEAKLTNSGHFQPTSYKQDYDYHSGSCTSDSSSGYLQFQDDDSARQNSKVYKTRNSSISITAIRTDASDDSGIMQDVELKQTQPPHHFLHSTTDTYTAEGIV